METTAGKEYRTALLLSAFTIIFNVIEGIVSLWFGYRGETLTLFGFGIDSFIEVISALGVYVMIKRIINNPDSPPHRFERTALKITGSAFYLLSIGLAVGIIINLYNGYKPEATLPGVIIALISIVLMQLLIYGKLNIGRKLNSAPIIADANCTKACVYMSVVLLSASLINELTGISYIDSLGTLGIIWFSVKEGKEAFEKSYKNKTT
jgi:divalent metal cation (Fe/Co/Zn/Cd) transporter